MNDSRRHRIAKLRLEITLLAAVVIPTTSTGCCYLTELIVDNAFDRNSVSTENLTKEERVRAFEEDFLRQRDFEEARKRDFEDTNLHNSVGHPRIFPALNE